ncbi:MAG: NUDIX hydrolase, partial [Litorimonas sp.]
MSKETSKLPLAADSLNPTHSNKPTDCVGVICLRGSDVLLIKRGKAPRKGEWSIPGGRIEAGETEQDAALRELFEETGVRAKLGPKIAVIDAHFEEFYYRLHDYAAIWQSGESKAGDDAADAKFTHIDTIS